MLGAFVGMFSETSLNIALPSLMSALSVSAGTVQWLVTGYMLVIGIFMPLSSPLTKWFSTKAIILFALGAFMVGALTSALGTSFAMVLVGRMIQGVGTGLVLPLMFSVAMQIFPPQKLGTIMGLCSLVIMFAPAIGPTVTGLVLAVLSWHYIFWLFIPFLLIAFIITAVAMSNVYAQTKAPLDWWSILASALGFGGIVIGTSFASDAGWLSPKVIVSVIIGVVALGWYVRRQRQLSSPMLDLRVFNTKAFTVGTLLVMLNFSIVLAATYLLPMYLQRVDGLPAVTAGLALLPGGLCNAVISAIAGRLYDSSGAKWLTRGGFTIVIISMLILLTTGTHTSLWVVILGNIVLMIGAPLTMSPAQSYGLNSLPGELSADGSAVLNTLQQVVGAVATAIATSMLSLGSAQRSGKAGLTLGTHYGFIFVLILAVMAVIVSLQITKPVTSRDVQ